MFGPKQRRISAHLRLSLLAVLNLIFVATSHAQGGPPLRTDDPGTPGNENWEINLGMSLDRSSSEHEFELPTFDINYGVGDRLQLKYESPWLVEKAPGSPYQTGLGQSLAGVKWRFAENQKTGLALSTYPQLEFNLSRHSEKSDLTNTGASFLLPLEVAKTFGPVNLDAETGHWFSSSHPGWISGLALGRQQNQRLELVAEGYRSSRRDDITETTIDAGGRYKLRDPIQLTFMAGHGVGKNGGSRVVAYFGLQFLLLDKWEPEDHPGSARP